jgi:DEAD/DEAH box helicase domain-containing protein
MEMGVDIPNVSLVINANLPPSISNYRQRVGRAGRRGEEWAFSMTFCRDLPLDRMAFDDPVEFLLAPIAAPAVRLDSATIVMRHVNAALLAAYLRSVGTFKVTGSCREFFGAQDDPATPFAPGSTADGFIAALQGPMRREAALGRDLERLTRGTILQNRRQSSLCSEAAKLRGDSPALAARICRARRCRGCRG